MAKTLRKKQSVYQNGNISEYRQTAKKGYGYAQNKHVVRPFPLPNFGFVSFAMLFASNIFGAN